jgi:hypothetical protein
MQTTVADARAPLLEEYTRLHGFPGDQVDSSSRAMLDGILQ